MIWKPFDRGLGSAQTLPKERKAVLCQIKSKMSSFPNPVVVGYMKFAAGDRDSPHFITPGAVLQSDDGERTLSEIISWCDCLPAEFEWPKERAASILQPSQEIDGPPN